MAEFKCYLKQHVREAFVKGPVSLLEAHKFLEKNEYGIVKDSNGTRFFDVKSLKFTEEENVKNIRPIDTSRLDSSDTSGESVSEDSDRELSGFDSDNSESSSERDN
jgi:hypothetical protein